MEESILYKIVYGIMIVGFVVGLIMITNANNKFREQQIKTDQTMALDCSNICMGNNLNYYKHIQKYESDSICYCKNNEGYISTFVM